MVSYCVVIPDVSEKFYKNINTLGIGKQRLAIIIKLMKTQTDSTVVKIKPTGEKMENMLVFYITKS